MHLTILGAQRFEQVPPPPLPPVTAAVTATTVAAPPLAVYQSVRPPVRLFVRRSVCLSPRLLIVLLQLAALCESTASSELTALFEYTPQEAEPILE